MVIGKDSRAYSRMVQLWRKNKDSVEVISGLKAGERVIVRGALSVQEKELVVTELPKK
jgi:multidrug efflux pump subunit AcrA (membrane-fusion protein)